MTQPKEWRVVPVEPTNWPKQTADHDRMGQALIDATIRQIIAAAPSPDTDAALVERVAEFLYSDLTRFERTEDYMEMARELLRDVIPGRKDGL